MRMKDDTTSSTSSSEQFPKSGAAVNSIGNRVSYAEKNQKVQSNRETAKSSRNTKKRPSATFSRRSQSQLNSPHNDGTSQQYVRSIGIDAGDTLQCHGLDIFWFLLQDPVSYRSNSSSQNENKKATLSTGMHQKQRNYYRRNTLSPAVFAHAFHTLQYLLCHTTLDQRYSVKSNRKMQ